MYLYALCLDIDRSQLPPGIRAPLQVIAVDGVHAIFEPAIDLDRLQQDDADLVAAILRHDQIICRLFAQTTVLPLRFGTQFSSEAALRTQLRTQADAYRRQLQILDGKAEMCLTLTPKSVDSPDLSPNLKGREYFLAKKQRLQDQAHLQESQQIQLVQLQQQVTAALPQSQCDDTQQHRIHLLLTPSQIAELPTMMDNWRTQCPLWDMSLSEALPPYHFVG